MNQCSVCGRSNTSPYIEGLKSVYTSEAYTLMRCNDCTHIWTSPMPSPETLTDIYTNHYAYDVHMVIEPEKLYRARKTADFLLEKTGAQTILEPGCMYGFLLIELQKRGKQSHGIEIDPKAAEYCASHGVPVDRMSLEEYTTSDKAQTFDCVILSHALEHIVDPHMQLSEIRKVLNPDGSLMIVVPNTDSWLQKLTKGLWGYWQVPVHINHFNRKSLSTLLERNGYTVSTVEYRGGDSLLFLSLLANLVGAKAEKGSITGIKKQIIRVYSFIAKYWYLIGNDDIIIVAKKSA